MRTKHHHKVKWNEHMIARALAMFVFERKHLVIVPNCNWTGDELDLLVVTRELRIIDVEIKISRADLKADIKKDKWFHNYNWELDGPWSEFKYENRRPRQFPTRVWKHYYALPKSIWSDDLKSHISPQSGVIVMNQNEDNYVFVDIVRRAKPCIDAEKINAEDAIAIARLASLRMWKTYEKLNQLTHDLKEMQNEKVS